MAKEQPETEKLLRASKCVAGIAPIPVGFDATVQFEAIPCGPKGLYNEAFARTMALINSQNIENGIIRLSPEQCEEFGLDKNYVVLNRDGIPEPQTADFYVMIPARHILAWRFIGTDDFRAKYGTMAREFYLGKKLLYYLVPNRSFDMAINTYNELFVNRMDVRPLGSIGFDTQNNSAEIIASIHYYIMPNPNDYDPATIAPILDPNIVSLAAYLEK